MAGPRRHQYPPGIDMLPQMRRRHFGLHHLYAIGFADGRTKIGVTCKPRDRVMAHSRNEGSIAWVHLFGVTTRGFETERVALALAASCSERIDGTEMFRWLPRSEAIACVREAGRRVAATYASPTAATEQAA